MGLLRNIVTLSLANEARRRSKASGPMGFGLGLIAARIATRSIPGALLVGGAMLAKSMIEKAEREGEEQNPDSPPLTKRPRLRQ